MTLARDKGGEGTAPAGVDTRPIDSADWRTQLPPHARQRIVNKILEILKRHLPGQEGVVELKNIAVMFEEKIYTIATSRQHYLWKICIKMQYMETISQHPMTNSLHPNAASSCENAHGLEAASYETISGPEESDEEEDDGDVSKEDGLEEVAVTEEQKFAVGRKENVKVWENEDIRRT